MAHTIAAPALTGNGVAFTVMTTDFVKRDCLITKEALDAISPNRAGEHAAVEVFQAYEAKICGVARRLIAANVPGTPLTLGPQSFR
ncbi:MAG TPA: DUF1488 family protein [Noviherbaspirillum sp.]